MTLTTRLAAVGAGLALTATLSACGAGPVAQPTASLPGTPVLSAPVATASSAPAHNTADTTFAQMMIIHHQGAIEMSDLAARKAVTGEVRALASKISAAQGPEIELMRGWLTSWGDATTPASHTGMDHGGMTMDGMSQEQVMTKLRGLSGVEFDKQFLTMMIAHHEGAVVMAEQQLKDGQSGETKALAEKIIKDQRAEIDQMSTMLANL